MLFADDARKKAYHKAYSQKWHREHQVERSKQIRQRKKEIAAFFANLRATTPCMKCGITHQAVLDFHHRDRQAKTFTIYAAIRDGRSIESILEEIKKCDPLCSNCHRILHWEERNYSDVD